MKVFTGSLFRQPTTSHGFWFVQKKNYSLAQSFGSDDNHIEYLCLHIYVYKAFFE
jgi:hypothetical protein